MKRPVLFIIAIQCMFLAVCQAQEKYFTKSGKVSFFSSTAMENIAAANKSAVCLLDPKTGELQFAVLLKGFEFKKALMQEHFNSDYVESDKFPKSEFKGQLVNNSTVNFSAAGSYKVNVKGKLTIHGVTKDIDVPGTIEVKDGKLTVNSSFNILIADYNISVPKLYRDNISESIKITVNCTLDAMK